MNTMNLDPLRASSTTNLSPGEMTAKMRGGAAASQALPSSGLTAFQSALLQAIAQTELSGLSALSLSGSLSGTSMTSGSSLTSLLGGMSGTASGGLLGGTSSQLLSLMLATAAQSGSTANLSNLAAALGGVTGFSSGSSLSPATLQTLGAPMQTFSNPSSAETPSSSSGSATTAHYEAMIAALAPQYGLSPSLVSAVVKQESNFSANATSQAGAMGLMQLMPQTAQSLGVTNAYDPVQNLQAGMSYLSQLIHRYQGDVPLALAAYNAGPSTVDAFGGIPPYPETQNYVSSIMQSVSATP